MNEEYMNADDMLDILSDRVLYPPEYIELIAGAVARINAAEGLGYTAFLSVSNYVAVSVMRKTYKEVRLDNVEEFQLFRSDMIALDDASGLNNLLKEVERFHP